MREESLTIFPLWYLSYLYSITMRKCILLCRTLAQNLFNFHFSVKMFCFTDDLFNMYFSCLQAGIAAAPARAVSAVKNMNIPQQIKDIKLPDFPHVMKDFKLWPIVSSEFQNIDISRIHFPADCSSLLHDPTTAKYTWYTIKTYFASYFDTFSLFIVS